MPRRTVITLAVLLVAWTAGATGAHAESWVPGPTLTESVANAPHVAIGADGGATVLWVDGAAGASSGGVAARRVASDGSPGTVQGLGTGVALDVLATGGGGLVAWAEVAAGGATLAVKTTNLSTADVTSDSRTVTIPTGSAAREPLGAIASDGSIVVSWLEDNATLPDESDLHVLRIAPDGSFGSVVDLGLAVEEESAYQLAVGSDGVARVMWRRSDVVGGGLLVARIGADGAESGTDLLTLNPEGTATLKVDGAHAIAGWLEAVTPGDMASSSMLRIKRLPSSGSVAVSPVTIVPSLFAPFPGVAFTLAPDGTATVVWSQSDPAAGNSVLNVRRVATNGSLGAVRTITSPPSGSVDLAPRLAKDRDGTTLVVWSRMNLASFSAAIVSGRLAADGTPIAGELPVTFSSATAASSPTLTVGPTGDALVTALGVRSDLVSLDLLTSRLVAPPVVPDPGPGPIPDPGPGGGLGPGLIPGPGGTPGPVPSPPSTARASARLKLTKATRMGARVSVTGTLDRRARGRVTLTWKQKVGRKTTTRTARATIKRGRFSATLKLPKALARSKAAGRLTVIYAGDGTLARASVDRSVRLTKAKPKKPAKRA
ncbi:MAG: hypothetical protein WC558_08035 [Patulibacter sp.]